MVDGWLAIRCSLFRAVISRVAGTGLACAREIPSPVLRGPRNWEVNTGQVGRWEGSLRRRPRCWPQAPEHNPLPVPPPESLSVKQ